MRLPEDPGRAAHAVNLDQDPLTSAPPLLLPLSLVALAVAVLAGRPLGRWLGTSSLVGVVIILNVGVMLAAALSPVVCDDPAVAGRCDLSRVGLATPGELLGSADIAANSVALAPLGFAIALVPRSRRKAILLAAAAMLPFAIEAVQLLVVPLGRACQSGDVVDNLTGLALGLAAGLVFVRLSALLRRSTPPPGLSS